MTSPSPPPTDRSAAPKKGAPRPPRLRSVLLVSALASIVTLALGVTGAIGIWHRTQPVEDTADRSDASLETLAAQALTGARDLSVFVRESATRDLSKVMALLSRSDKAADAGDEATKGDLRSRPAADRVAEPSSADEESAPLSHGVEPLLAATLIQPSVAPELLEPPLVDLGGAEVTPPLFERIRLRQTPRYGPHADGASEEVGLVEVVVSRSGTVESAKFVTRPLDVHESMLLSAVKAWRFRPATRNGRAVRYRLRMPISRARI